MNTHALWSTQVGSVNVVTYEPGESVQAFPGCPVFEYNWVNVYWYPGIVERITVHMSHAEAVAEYAGRTARVELTKEHVTA
jgi:hypothetical protein